MMPVVMCGGAVDTAAVAENNYAAAAADDHGDDEMDINNKLARETRLSDVVLVSPWYFLEGKKKQKERLG